MKGVAIRHVLAEMLEFDIFEPVNIVLDGSNCNVAYPGSKVPPLFIYQTREAPDHPWNKLRLGVGKIPLEVYASDFWDGLQVLRYIQIPV
ncbi:hypothetical protein PIB30_056672 [Stylosanthes scabra]|uniref:Uncharacterized protein n=1 Tax=Stylosanthes scabra TaxID=79078 RepID=A0ABU6XHC2_9FABA|nr:hypothetical protein [Stylosanthes scabra]